MKFPFCVKLPDFQKERILSGDQKTMLPLQKTLPITSKKGLHLEGAAKTKYIQAMAFREKDIQMPSLRIGRAETLTPRGGTKEWPDGACHSRK